MRTIFYRNYTFRDKDLLIDAMRTVKQKEKLNNYQLHQISGIAATTFNNWFDGDTRCPQNATATQAMGALGYARQDAITKYGQVVPRFVKIRELDYLDEITKQADFLLKHGRKKKNGKR